MKAFGIGLCVVAAAVVVDVVGFLIVIELFDGDVDLGF